MPGLTQIQPGGAFEIYQEQEQENDDSDIEPDLSVD